MIVHRHYTSSTPLGPPAARQGMFGSFSVGTRVELRGLKTRPDLNGRVGEVADTPQAGRIPVLLQGDYKTDRELHVALKPENLSVVRPRSVDCVSRPVASNSRFNTRMHAQNVWEIDIDPSIIDAAVDLLPSSLHTDPVNAYELCSQWLADAVKDTYDRIRTPAGSFFGQRVRNWSSDLGWVSVDDAATYKRFETLFHRMQLPDRFASVVPHTRTLRLYSAFFVVRSRCDAPSWHEDYLRSVGTDALTLITPLYDYEETESFQLLYRATEGDSVSDGGEATQRRYSYRRGKALVFGSRFEHATEPGSGRDGEAHCYLSLTFGTDEQRRWAEIGKTLETQSRVLVQPDGTMRLTHLGEQLPWKLEAHRELPNEIVLERVRIQLEPPAPPLLPLI